VVFMAGYAVPPTLRPADEEILPRLPRLTGSFAGDTDRLDSLEWSAARPGDFDPVVLARGWV